MDRKYIQSEHILYKIQKMGNDVCKSVQTQNNQLYKQTLKSQEQSSKKQKKNISQSLSSGQIKNNKMSYLKSSYFQSKENQIPLQTDMLQIKYKDYQIKCKKNNVKYIKSNKLSIQIPIINGVVQVHKRSRNAQKYVFLYEGQMKKSKLSGFGKLYQNNKIIYEGQFKNNQYNGWGITFNYQGQFRDGKFDGYGIYKQYQNQINKKYLTFYYQGYFQNGLYSGSGVKIMGGKLPIEEINKIHKSDGIFQYLNLQIQNNLQIIQTYGIKQIYIGQFSNGYCHGFGRQLTQNQQFSGQFSFNLYHGIGTIYSNKNGKQKVIQAVFKMGQLQK